MPLKLTHYQLMTNTEQALAVVEYYKQRWGVEEYHKALKTGAMSKSVTTTRLHAWNA